MSPDETEGQGSQFQGSARPDKHLARTLEDVSHLFLSGENAGSAVPAGIPRGSPSQIEKENERLKRAVADLTVDNLILRDAAKKLKDLERENELLRRAVADLTLDNLILKDAVKGNY